MKAHAVILLGLALLGAAQAFTKVELPTGINGVSPVISNTTMNYHYNKHYATYIKNLNDAYGGRKQPSLTDAIKSAGKADTVNRTAIRNQGGGAWNHALYFTTLAVPNSALTKETALSQRLADAIKKAFPADGVAGLRKNVSDAAMGVFGSGWAWVCVARDGSITVVTTPNQDNPLMGGDAYAKPPCTPILGIDVWEHAYYVDHGPARKDYVDGFWGVVDWGRVSKNYASAVAGKPDEIVA